MNDELFFDRICFMHMSFLWPVSGSSHVVDCIIVATERTRLALSYKIAIVAAPAVNLFCLYRIDSNKYITSFPLNETKITGQHVLLQHL